MSFERALTGTGHPDLDTAGQLCDLCALLPALLDVHVDWGVLAFRQEIIMKVPYVHTRLHTIFRGMYGIPYIWSYGGEYPRESGKIGVYGQTNMRTRIIRIPSTR